MTKTFSCQHTRLLLWFLLVVSVGDALAEQVRVWIPGWRDSAPMSTARAGGAVVATGNMFYVIGGIDGRNFLRTVEIGRVEKDGRISAWHSAPPLNEERGFFDAIAHNGYVYAVGGGNGPGGHNLLRSVERARISADGTLSPWETLEQQLNLPRRCVKVVVANNRLYAVGGFGGTLLDTVESAPLNSDGSLGTWRIEDKTMIARRYVHSVKLLGNQIWVLGGHQEDQGVGLSTVEIGTIGDDGTIKEWRAAASLNHGRYGLSSIRVGNYAFAMGGLGAIDYLRSVEKIKLEGNNAASPWQETNPLSTPRANFSVAAYKDWLFIIGGTNEEGYFDTVEAATVNERGDLGFWGNAAEGRAYEQQEKSQQRAATSLPLPNSGVVEETISAGQYTYLNIKTMHGSEWVATAKGDYQPGQHVIYSEGIMMSNFYSKSLQRTFASIRFVSRVDPVQTN